MKPQNIRLSLIVACALVVGGFLGVVVYPFAFVKSSIFIASNSNIPAVSTTSGVIVGAQATSSSSAFPSTFSSSSGAIAAASPGPVDMSGWKTYTNYELGFTFQYPQNLLVDTSNPAAVVLTFPSSYFSSEMIDSDIFSITVSASCTPSASVTAADAQASPQSVTLGGITFTENSQINSSAGNYNEVTLYQANNNSVCYTIEYDSSAASSNDIFSANIQAIVQDILSTFTFVSTPAGENEADYAATQDQSIQTIQQPSGRVGAGSVTLTFALPNPVSVGGSITLSGYGFLGGSSQLTISNGSVQGILWSGVAASDTSLSVVIPPHLCTQITAPSGAACPAYLVLSPGVYTLSLSNENGTTEPVYIRLQ